MRSDEATTRDLAAALIEFLLTYQEDLRREGGKSADLKSKIDYTLSRLRGVHQNKEPLNE